MKSKTCLLILISLVPLHLIVVSVFIKRYRMGTAVSDQFKEFKNQPTPVEAVHALLRNSSNEFKNQPTPVEAVHELLRNSSNASTAAPVVVKDPWCRIKEELENQLEASTRNGSSLIMSNKVFKERRDLYRKSCDRSCPQGRHAGMFIMSSKALSICETPKVGCTFWKRIFRFLSGDVEKGTNSPFQMTRYFAHHIKARKQWGGSLLDENVKNNVRESTRAIFAREPYARLWSAYLDKFILPDSWGFYGKDVITKHRRNTSTTERDGQGQICGSDITFPEFLAWSLKNSNPHWHPITSFCPPCLLQPHVIGHMETFATDAALLLNASGLQRFAEEGLSRKDYVKNEMWGLTDYQFTTKVGRMRAKCVDAQKLAARLWRVFQLNGYLPAEQEFPAAQVRRLLSSHSSSTSSPTSSSSSSSTSSPTSSSTSSSTSMQRLLFEFYYGLNRAAGKTPAQWKQQKTSAMLDAYREVPLETLLGVREKFREDFQVFGYDPMPREIFGNRV